MNSECSSFSYSDLKFEHYIEEEFERFKREISKLNDVELQKKCILVFPPLKPRARFLIHNWLSTSSPSLKTVSIGSDEERRTVIFFPNGELQPQAANRLSLGRYQPEKVIQKPTFNENKSKCFIVSMEGQEKTPSPRSRAQKRPDRELYVPRHRQLGTASPHSDERHTDSSERGKSRTKSSNKNKTKDEGLSSKSSPCSRTTSKRKVKPDDVRNNTEAKGIPKEMKDDCKTSNDVNNDFSKEVEMDLEVVKNVSVSPMISNGVLDDVRIDEEDKTALKGIADDVVSTTTNSVLSDSSKEVIIDVKGVKNGLDPSASSNDSSSDEFRISKVAKDGTDFIAPSDDSYDIKFNDGEEHNVEFAVASSTASNGVNNISLTKEESHSAKDVENAVPFPTSTTEMDGSPVPEKHILESTPNKLLIKSDTSFPLKDMSFETFCIILAYNVLHLSLEMLKNENFMTMDCKSEENGVGSDLIDNKTIISGCNVLNSSCLVDQSHQSVAQCIKETNLHIPGYPESEVSQQQTRRDESEQDSPLISSVSEKQKIETSIDNDETATPDRKENKLKTPVRKMKVHKKSPHIEKSKQKSEKDLSDAGKERKENISKQPNQGEDAWDVNWDETGECLNEAALTELKKLTKISDPKVFHAEKPEIDYLSYEPKEIDLTSNEFNHLIEVYGFKPDLKTTDICLVMQSAGLKDFDIKWVDDTHAIAIFSNASLAHRATQISSLTLKTRALFEGTRQSKLKAKSFKDMLLPYKPRPETTASVARNLVTSALGIRPKISREQRSAEKKRIAAVKESKRIHEERKREAWGE